MNIVANALLDTKTYGTNFIQSQISMSVDWTKEAVITSVSTELDITTANVKKVTLFKAITGPV